MFVRHECNTKFHHGLITVRNFRWWQNQPSEVDTSSVSSRISLPLRQTTRKLRSIACQNSCLGLAFPGTNESGDKIGSVDVWLRSASHSDRNWSDLWVPWSGRCLLHEVICSPPFPVLMVGLLLPELRKNTQSISGIIDGWLSTRLIGQKFTLFQHLEAFHTFSVLAGLRICFLRWDSDELTELKWASLTLPLLITKLVKLLKNCTTATTDMCPVVPTTTTLHEISSYVSTSQRLKKLNKELATGCHIAAILWGCVRDPYRDIESLADLSSHATSVAAAATIKRMKRQFTARSVLCCARLQTIFSCFNKLIADVTDSSRCTENL